MNRIAKIVHHLLHHPEELLSVFYGSACLFNVDDIELETIKHILMQHDHYLGGK